MTTIWEASYRGWIMRKVIRKEVAAGGRLGFFLDSDVIEREVIWNRQ